MSETARSAQRYYRSLARADSIIGWPEIPDCPMDVFAKIMQSRAELQPELLTMTREEVEAAGLVEKRTRLFSESAWKSEKIDKIEPVQWRAEYAWLYSIALADGTFEAAPKLVWSAAYAHARPDWDSSKVGELLDELERVGLLERATDENGKVWGHWVGSEPFLPSPERIKKSRYKVGRGDLFRKEPVA